MVRKPVVENKELRQVMDDMDVKSDREIKRHQTKETAGVVLTVLGVLWLGANIAILALGDVKVPPTFWRMALAFVWFGAPVVMIVPGLRVVVRHHRAITSLSRQHQPAAAAPAAGSSFKLSRRSVFALTGIGTGLVLVCLVQYWRTRPIREEQRRAQPKVFVVTEPTTLTGAFFGVSFGSHRITGEFLDKKWSRSVSSVFFLSDPNETPFLSELPREIGIDSVTARLSESIAYIVARSIETRCAWTADFGGRIVVYVDNASDSDIIVTVDSEPPRRIPALSYAKITVAEGFHTFASRPVASGEPADARRVFLCDYDRRRFGRTIEWYVYNVGGRNRYDLESARYVSSKRD